MTDLGILNGWGIIPKIVSDCEDKSHDVKSKKTGNCITKFSCELCDYSYLIDSSG